MRPLTLALELLRLLLEEPFEVLADRAALSAVARRIEDLFALGRIGYANLPGLTVFHRTVYTACGACSSG